MKTIIAIHGLEAYSGKRKPIHQLLEQAVNIEFLHACAEICGSDSLVGEIGLVLSGECVGAFATDCWSFVENGKREVSHSAEYTIFRNQEEDEEQDFMFASEYTDFYRNNGGINQKAALRCSNESTRYCEFFMRKNEVLAVVVKSTASARIMKRARVLARALGVYVTFEDSYESTVARFSASTEPKRFDELDFLYELQEKLSCSY